jgi:Protein of unknown function (DUF1553)/Protein of unknown function (DUF1549)/Planctomycete cytochrome C
MNIVSTIILCLALSALVPAGAFADDFSTEAIEFFEKDVRPLLIDKCSKCHGDTKPKGRLRLTSRSTILEGGASGPAAIPGKPADSLLLKAVRHQPNLEKMPPEGKLSDRQIAILERWIQLGMPWTKSVTKTNPPELPAKEAVFWAFRPVKVVPPESPGKGWAVTEVDRYVLAGMKAKGLKPMARTDRATLLRRATFDLIGLPPTPAEIDAFVQDESPDAFAKVVDRLLASPHYGERWGRHWLDVIRYADSSGRVAEFKEIWRYRDWVTKAFNEDLPYTDFIKLQLAGDLLQPADPNRFNEDGLVATGMLAISQFDPGSMKPQLHADSVDDMVDVVSRSFLGLTLACARCHNHKFDPLTVEDYYGLAGIFANIRTTASLNMDPVRVIVPLATPAEVERAEKLRKEIADLEKKVQELQQRLKAKSKESPADIQAQIAEKTKHIDDLKTKKLPVLPKAVVVKEGGHADTLFKTFHDAPIHLRGDPLKLGKVVPRGFPKVLGAGQPIRQGSGRLELAAWLTRADHPLTARVMVNRIWQHHMGEGIVRTPNNFGEMGERPTHPELLDFLADHFVRSGWSIKAMHRLIMNSAVYQQSSSADGKLDPANRQWSRMNRRRLDAEAFRDSFLAVSGKLDRTIGGPGTEDLMTTRRTHYYMTIRSATKPNSFNVLFERPDPALISDQRSELTLASQALFLLNDPFVIAQAKALAQRLDKETPATKDDAKIRHLYRLVLGRLPTPREIEVGLGVLRQAPPTGYNAWERYAHVLLCTNEFLYVD